MTPSGDKRRDAWRDHVAATALTTASASSATRSGESRRCTASTALPERRELAARQLEEAP